MMFIPILVGILEVNSPSMNILGFLLISFMIFNAKTNT